MNCIFLMAVCVCVILNWNVLSLHEIILKAQPYYLALCVTSFPLGLSFERSCHKSTFGLKSCTKRRQAWVSKWHQQWLRNIVKTKSKAEQLQGSGQRQTQRTCLTEGEPNVNPSIFSGVTLQSVTPLAVWEIEKPAQQGHSAPLMCHALLPQNSNTFLWLLTLSKLFYLAWLIEMFHCVIVQNIVEGLFCIWMFNDSQAANSKPGFAQTVSWLMCLNDITMAHI